MKDILNFPMAISVFFKNIKQTLKHFFCLLFFFSGAHALEGVVSCFVHMLSLLSISISVVLPTHLLYQKDTKILTPEKRLIMVELSQSYLTVLSLHFFICEIKTLVLMEKQAKNINKQFKKYKFKWPINKILSLTMTKDN